MVWKLVICILGIDSKARSRVTELGDKRRGSQELELLKKSSSFKHWKFENPLASCVVQCD